MSMVVAVFEIIIQIKDYLAIIVIAFTSVLSIASVLSGRLVDSTLPDTKTPSKYTSPTTSSIAFTLVGDMVVAIGVWIMMSTNNMILIAMSGIFMLFGFMILITVIVFSFAVIQKYKNNIKKYRVCDPRETI